MSQATWFKDGGILGGPRANPIDISERNGDKRRDKIKDDTAGEGREKAEMQKKKKGSTR